MARVTVLQLDTAFPRVPGDVGCPQTYNAPPQIIRVPGASVRRIVTGRPDLIDIGPFEAALAEAEGDVVVTSCGFLATWQGHLVALTDRPFVASALCAVEELSQKYVPEEVMVLTFDAARLGAVHFGGFPQFAMDCVGLSMGMHLRQVIEGNAPELDQARVERELVDLVRNRITDRHRVILLECTNLPPYAPALRREFGVEVVDILTCIEGVCEGAVRPEYLR